MKMNVMTNDYLYIYISKINDINDRNISLETTFLSGGIGEKEASKL